MKFEEFELTNCWKNESQEEKRKPKKEERRE
jgi:hypothetical protein